MNAVERPELGPHGREDGERCHPRGRPTLLERQVGSDLPDDRVPFHHVAARSPAFATGAAASSCSLARALVGVNVLAGAMGTNFTTNFSAPNTESTRASNLLAANFKAQSGDSVQVVMKGSPSMRDAAVEHQAKSFIAALAKLPHVASVSDPFETPGGISKSGTVALANAQLDAKSQDVPDSVGRQMINLAEKHSTPQLEVRLGGQLIQQSERPSLSGEGIGIIAAILILLIAFGSVLAMVLPIVVALAGIAVGLAIIGLLTHVYPLQSFSTTLATMIGIGVGHRLRAVRRHALPPGPARRVSIPKKR